jgi:crotonobetainyl-CoA:carnitine CoA-transferase CaiB-like acyl-CoA transferase
MILSNFYLNCEDALSYAGKLPRPPVDRLQLGTGATYRLYETAPVGSEVARHEYENADPRWVFFAAVNDDEFARYCKVAGRADLLDDSRFATAAARNEHREALEAILASAFKTRSAPDWESSLVDAGVGCAVADGMSHFSFLYRDSQARAINMVVKTEHPTFGGKYWRYAPVIQFSKTPGLAGPYCETGESTRSILKELGYDEEEIGQLNDAEVVTWPASDPDVTADTG